MNLHNVAISAPSSVRYNSQAVGEIINSIEEGTYCAVLGPRLSGKTVLLQFVTHYLQDTFGWNTIYIDLHQLKGTTQRGFFADLMYLTSGILSDSTGHEFDCVDPQFASSSVFRGFLTDCLGSINRDIVLFIEHLEALPTDLVQALLTSLRAAYMDQQGLGNRLTVVVSGALSLAMMTVGESSPFRGIARRIFIGDLSREQSRALILEYLSERQVTLTLPALNELLQATNGDQFLIHRICDRCFVQSQKIGNSHLGINHIRQVIQDFLREEALQYAPLIEAMHIIEGDPDLLECVMALLQEDTVHRTRLPIPLSPDLDPLYLTGIVELVDGEYYRIQNSIYRYFIKEYLNPGRVGRALAMTGRWDGAIDYLESGMNNGDEGLREELLSATLNSIYASEDLEQASHFLMRGLLAGFDLLEVKVWLGEPRQKRLRLLGSYGSQLERELVLNPEIGIDEEHLESIAYRRSSTMRGQESERGVRRAIPLLVPGGTTLGVVSVCERMVYTRFPEQKERDRRMMAYVNQAARALHTIRTRRMELDLAGTMQASLIIKDPPEIDGWQFSARLYPKRETSGDFYDFIPLSGGRYGLVIADVADKGMGAALYMALSRTLIRTYAPNHPDRPDIVMRTVNERILSDTQAGLFVTVFYGVLDPINGKLTYCNAGHNPPYLYLEGNSDAIETLGKTGMALGVTYDAVWRPAVVSIPEKALMVFYTDGIIDARRVEEHQFGDQRLLEIILDNKSQSAQEIHEAIISGIREFVGDSNQYDDMALIVLKRETRLPIYKKVPPIPGRKVL